MMKNPVIFKTRHIYTRPRLTFGYWLTIFYLLVLFNNGTGAFAQVGVHTDFPEASSAMDIYATNKGLLIPRVSLTSDLTDPSPVTAPAIGLLVFNSGPDQPMGFYYWDEVHWVALGGGSASGDYWSLYGNSGTTVTVNFVGTTDSKDLAFRTNNVERMRLELDGQVIIGGTTPLNTTDLFTVFGNSTQTAAINAYSPRTGFQTVGGRYGILSTVDTANGFALYSRNLDALGYGIVTAASGYTTVGLIASHTAGIHSQGYDGLHAWGKSADGYGIFAMGSNAAGPFNLTGVSAGMSAVGSYGIIARGSGTTGRGIVAIGSGQTTPSTSLESEGGAFKGHHGIYAMGVGSTAPLGIGVIGVGYNASTYSTITGYSLGGSFTGNYGVYGKAISSDGVGVLGLGSNGAGYYTVTNGSGGAFTGYHGLLAVGSDVVAGTGVFGAGNNGSYVILPAGAGGVFTGVTTGGAGFGTSPSSGLGVIGAGNGQAAWVPSNGAGGAFTGNTGVFCRSTNTTGTGIVATGNNLASPGTYANGSGGSFTGTAAGVVCWGTTAATGIGVIGTGNNATTSIPATGCGGAFTGSVCGVYGYATNTTNSNRYGGYFETAGAYAYVGVRYSNTNRKILGTNSVSTIVKDTKGDLVILTCPEAPETVFQDFGIARLVNGQAHITIDPDLSININVSESHPLKVYITPEGDCNGVYVTNKSANGFDVIELQNGKSNVEFSWQIVATRADESYTLKDGKIEVAVNSERFPPAPGPLEMTEQSSQINQMTILETVKLEKVMSGQESMKTTQTFNENILEVKEDEVIENRDRLDE